MAQISLDDCQDIPFNLLDVNFDPRDDRWHILTCRNLETGRKFKMPCKYEYAYQVLSTSPGLNISHWYYNPFRELLNRMIQYETPLIWKAVNHVNYHDGFILKNSDSDDPFFAWVSRHNKRAKHPDWVYDSDDSEFELDSYEMPGDYDQTYPNNDTNSDESCDDFT